VAATVAGVGWAAASSEVAVLVVVWTVVAVLEAVAKGGVAVGMEVGMVEVCWVVAKAE